MIEKFKCQNPCLRRSGFAQAGKCQMNVKFKKGILKSKTLNWFQGKVQNDIFIMPNQVLNLIQDLRISASHSSFGFDLNLEL
jgi:hypothetical protein